MASIYIVNHTISGMYPENWTSYHHTESEASDAYDECVASSSEDPNLIALIRLDTETLEAVTLRDWEGTCEDLEEEGYYGDDEDDGIVEGSP